MRIDRLAGTGILLGLLLTGSACASAQQETSAPQQTAAQHQHGTKSPAPPKSLREGERFVEVSMAQAYAPAAPHGGNDDYRCFLVDPGITTASYLTGSQFLPQNAAVVHHAIFFRINPEEAAAAAKLDASTAGQGWTCFGNAGITDNSGWVASWAPGKEETVLRSGIGYPMAAGSKLVMQVHYNLLATKPGETDRSSMRLRVTGKTGLTPLSTMILAAPIELACGPGEQGPLCDRAAAVRDNGSRFGAKAASIIDRLNQFCNQGRPPVPANETHCDYPVREAGTVYLVGGHMHLLGRSVRVELNPGRPGARTLFDEPSYNFDEQGARPLAEPAAVKPGDKLRVTCTHDVGLRRRLPELRDQPPRYVVWGEGTADEMCVGIVTLARKKPN